MPQNQPKSHNWNRYFGIFLLLYALYGFWCLPSFGSPTDEQTQRFIGMENARYIAGQNSRDKIAQHQFFGPIVETPLYLMEQLVYSKDTSVKLYLRHSVIFALFLAALAFFYKLLKRLSNNSGASFFITLTLACNPRLFAHAHYNSKDTAFICFLIFGIYCFVKFTQEKKFITLLIAAVWIGLATSIRLAGVFVMVACTSTLAFALRNYGKPILYFCLLSILSFVAAFPYLWVDTFKGIGQLINYTSNNPYPWKVLFAGKLHPVGRGIWYYVPLSMALTTGIIVLALFLIFIIRAIKSILSKRFGLEQIFVFQLFMIPFLYFVISAPVFYNMGRHTQFMLIPVYLGAGLVLNHIWENAIAKRTVLAFLLLTCLALPIHKGNEMVYFNGLKSFWKPYSFEMDYWTVSGKRALEDVLEKENATSVYCFDPTIKNSWQMLPPKQREKIRFVSKDSAHVELQFFRETPLKATHKTLFSYGSKREPYLLVNRLR